MTDTRLIRNFSIVAHVDHGKSTLADRLLELTLTVEKRQMKEQLLDDMELERERGITIKARAVAMRYKAADGQTYLFNLIDTPGHVDFNYEVQKSLQACEGALLLVDASQGVEAQTVVNALLAEQAQLAVVPVLNKIDLPHARPEQVATEVEDALCIPAEDAIAISAKTGVNCEQVLEAIVALVPPPVGNPDNKLQALIFDAAYDDYRGVVIYMRVKEGTIRKGDSVRTVAAGKAYEVLEIGRLAPRMVAENVLHAGEVGYLICNIKQLEDVKIGDTVTHEKEALRAPALAGFKDPKPMVFCGFYPTNTADFDDLRKSLEKLRINDSSFSFEPETSDALGFGFRCGFLGLLHMEVIQQRLEREQDMDLVQTAPNVTYRVVLTDGTEKEVRSPSEMPDPARIESYREPIVEVRIVVPTEHIGAVMKLATDRRGIYEKTDYYGSQRVMLTFAMPFSEIIFDFHDRLKSATRGFATMDYELRGFEDADLVKVRILVSTNEVDALSFLCHRTVADTRGRKILQKLRTEIPRHLFEVALQAAVGGKIIARENIRALSKNVTAKCYGGDITRKRKLLEKQKKGKKRMKQVGNVEIPQAAFLSVLSTGDD
ncbi:MAG: translation elongation factor 4 [Planctomycetota bacterium]|nr:translation elongation factor 4 [Planctomycetota bacterium]MDA0933929.1 translation elongation factor 4 [Planctomycetota bacterium]MDA1220791.1 translation elongation factor 4 [Planctomycetota bacterium]